MFVRGRTADNVSIPSTGQTSRNSVEFEVPRITIISDQARYIWHISIGSQAIDPSTNYVKNKLKVARRNSFIIMTVILPDFV